MLLLTILFASSAVFAFCEIDAHCQDENECTTEVCNEGQCEYTDVVVNVSSGEGMFCVGGPFLNTERTQCGGGTCNPDSPEVWAIPNICVEGECVVQSSIAGGVGAYLKENCSTYDFYYCEGDDQYLDEGVCAEINGVHGCGRVGPECGEIPNPIFPYQVGCNEGYFCDGGDCLPTCGNEDIDPGEDCDTEQTCDPGYTCTNECICEFTEECLDDNDCEPDEFCDGFDCMPICGNEDIDPGEDCDTEQTCDPGYICTNECLCVSESFPGEEIPEFNTSAIIGVIAVAVLGFVFLKKR